MRGLWIGLALALVAVPAWAQGRRAAPKAAPAASAPTPQQRDWCDGFTATADQKIEGCTALIQSGRETTLGLAIRYNMRGVMYASKGQYDQAIADYTQVIALRPDSAIYYVNRAAAYQGKGLYDQAIGDYTRAIALAPDYLTAYYSRASVYYHKGLYDQAIADYTQVIAFKPNFAVAYQNRGIAYEKKGSRDQAIADYRAQLKLDPNLQKARDGLTRLGVTP